MIHHITFLLFGFAFPHFHRNRSCQINSSRIKASSRLRDSLPAASIVWACPLCLVDIHPELVQQDGNSMSDSPRRSSRRARPSKLMSFSAPKIDGLNPFRFRLSMSTGGSAPRPPALTQPATQRNSSTDLFKDSVQEDLPTIIINQWKPPASQSEVKEGRPRRCT